MGWTLIRYLIAIALIFILPLSVSAQNIDAFDRVEKALDDYRSIYPIEKVYLHFDRPYYYSGDDMWFTAYLAAGPTHQPSPMSKVVYVELISESDSLLKRIKLPVEESVAKGDFKIPQFFESGNYKIRAYTNWMRNFDHGLFFSRDIVIIRPYDGEAPVVEETAEISLRAYPEGGDLVAGLRSKVAVKLFGSPNATQNQQLVVVDNQGNTISKFLTNNDGIGVFELVPTNSSEYFVQLANKSNRFPLPKPLEQGYSLSVDNLASKDFLNVTALTTDLQRRLRGYVVVQSRNILRHFAEVAFIARKGFVEIPKHDLLPGVNHVTLFDSKWRPVAERLVFLNDLPTLDVRITTDKREYFARDSTILTLEVTDVEGNPVEGAFSVSVVDSAQVNAHLSKEDILSNLLLTSEIKGYLHNPSRFFSDPNDQKLSEALDRILMTHGWRRFKWQNVLNGQSTVPEFTAEQGIMVKGQFLRGERPVVNGSVSHIGSYHGRPSFASTSTSNDGLFELDSLYFFEDEENFLEGKTARGRKANVTIDSTWQRFPGIGQDLNSYNQLDTFFIKDHIEKSKEREYLKSLYDVADGVRDLGEYVVEGTRKTRSGFEVFQYDFDEILVFSQYTTLFQVLQRGTVQGVTIEGDAHYRRLFYWGSQVENYYIDGVGYRDSTHARLMHMPAWQVKRFSAPANVVTRTEEELLKFYKAIGDKRVSVLPGGFYRAREYFSPDYSTPKPEHDVPDKRILVHWEPLIRTDSSGKATIKYFNADMPTTITIALEGLTDTGTPTVAQRSYTVRFKDGN